LQDLQKHCVTVQETFALELGIFIPAMETIERSILNLFAHVREALGRATYALLSADVELAQAVVDGDQEIDDVTAELELAIWSRIDEEDPSAAELRHLVALLLILPELERSADLAEHIAQRALSNVGAEMTPLARGIVQRMSEVAAEMWQVTAAAFVDRAAGDLELHEEDEELDILADRLTSEIAKGEMSTSVGAQVTLISRFYERIGDHAVNLSRRIAALPT
jgi:phosphate transport system protein